MGNIKQEQNCPDTIHESKVDLSWTQNEETKLPTTTMDNIEKPISPKIELRNIIEALLFAENNPLTLNRFIEITNNHPEDIIQAITELNNEYESSNHSFRIEKVANGYQLYTLPEYSQWVRSLYKSPYHRLSRAALETLAIIVYNQPITRPEIEKLRGVDCSGPLLTLLERKLIRIEGRARKPGGPFLYGTGKEFLRYFGISTLNDLPSKEELGAFLQRQGEQNK